jgi:NAD-dependent deacetylase
MTNLNKASEIIRNANYLTAFTGAGVSKESGIPVFRGGDGVYSKYDHSLLEIKNYKAKTSESWKAVKAIFYDFFESAKPNPAHLILANWEKQGLLKHIITQNIDNLHQAGGSENVIEYHGSKDKFVCLKCEKDFKLAELTLSEDPPLCNYCGGLLKPDFVFFGEAIPEKAARLSYDIAKQSDVMIIIGTTGEVQPASHIPYYAKRAGAIIIEINPEESKFTATITDIFIKMKAAEAMTKLDSLITKE